MGADVSFCGEFIWLQALIMLVFCVFLRDNKSR